MPDPNGSSPFQNQLSTLSNKPSANKTSRQSSVVSRQPTPAQSEILAHTFWRAANRCFCTSVADADMQALIAIGLMREVGRPSFLTNGDAYFTLTTAGVAFLKGGAA